MERNEDYQGRVDRSAVVGCLGIEGRRSWLDCHSTPQFSGPDLQATLTLNSVTVDELRSAWEYLRSHLIEYNEKWESTFVSSSNEEILILATKMQSGVYDLFSGSFMQYKKPTKDCFRAECIGHATCQGKLSVTVGKDGLRYSKVVPHNPQCVAMLQDFWDFGNLKQHASLLAVLLLSLVTDIFPNFGIVMYNSRKVSHEHKRECILVFLQYFSLEYLSPLNGKEKCEPTMSWFSGLYDAVASTIRNSTGGDGVRLWCPWQVSDTKRFTISFGLWLLFETTPKRKRREPIKRTLSSVESTDHFVPENCFSAFGPATENLFGGQTSPSHGAGSNTTVASLWTPQLARSVMKENKPPTKQLLTPPRGNDVVEDPTSQLQRFFNYEFEQMFGGTDDWKYATRLQENCHSVEPTGLTGTRTASTPLEGIEHRGFCRDKGIDAEEIASVRVGKQLNDNVVGCMQGLIVTFHQKLLGPGFKKPVLLNTLHYHFHYKGPRDFQEEIGGATVFDWNWNVNPRLRKRIEKNDFDHIYDETDMTVLSVCEQGHWRMYTAHIKRKVIRGWDSLGFSPNGYNIEALEQWFVDHCKMGEKGYWENQKGHWQVDSRNLSGRQVDGNSCGVFVIMNFLYVINSLEENAREVTQDRLNMDCRVRLWIVFCLLRGEFVDPFQRRGAVY